MSTIEKYMFRYSSGNFQRRVSKPYQGQTLLDQKYQPLGLLMKSKLAFITIPTKAIPATSQNWAFEFI
jgi:hypothetical protein